MGIEKINSEGAEALRKIVSSIDKKSEDETISFKNGINKEEFIKNINTAGGGKLAKEAELLFGILNTGGGDTLDKDELSIIQDKEGAKTTGSTLRSKINDLLLEKNPDLKKSGRGSYTFDGKKDASDAVKELSKKAVTLPKNEQMKILKEHLGIDTDKNDAGKKDAFYKKKLKDGSVEFYRVVNDNGQTKIIHTIMKGKEASSEVFDLKTKTSSGAKNIEKSKTAEAPKKDNAAEVSNAELTEEEIKEEIEVLKSSLKKSNAVDRGRAIESSLITGNPSDKKLIAFIKQYPGGNLIKTLSETELPKRDGYTPPRSDYRTTLIPYIYQRLTEAAKSGADNIKKTAEAILKENEDIFKKYIK